MRLTYTQAVQEDGGLAVVLPAHGYVDDAEALADRLDGLIFSGGPDLDPGTYGQARHPRLGPGVDRVGDEYELALHAVAAERDLPVLGICRGMQALTSPVAGRCTSTSRTTPRSTTTRATRPTSPRTRRVICQRPKPAFAS